MDVRNGLIRVRVLYSIDRLIPGALTNTTIYIYGGGSASVDDQISPPPKGSCVSRSSNCRQLVPCFGPFQIFQCCIVTFDGAIASFLSGRRACQFRRRGPVALFRRKISLLIRCGPGGLSVALTTDVAI